MMYKINPSFETPELKKAIDDLLKATDKVRRKETRLTVYRRYIFVGHVNLN